MSTAFAAGQGSDRAAASLAVRYSLPPDGGHDRTLVLEALGPAPAGQVTLVDQEGRTSVRVAVLNLSNAACQHAPVRDTGLGEDRWCLQLAGLRAGSEVTGKLSGPSSVVTLKVAARHGLRLPVAFSVLVLLLAAGFVLYTSSLMGERASRLLTMALLRRRSDVAGLRDWAESAKDFLTWERIRSLVGWMRERGRQRATRARASLAAAEEEVSGAGLPDCPLRTSARDEAGSTVVRATDLVSPRGAILDHPAHVLEEALGRAVDLLDDFNTKVELLMPLVPQERMGDAEAKVRQTRASFTTISASDVESALPARLNETTGLLTSYIGQAAASAFMGTRASATSTSITTTPRERFREVAEVGAASWPIMAAIVVLMVVATVAALSANYAQKPTFGTATDYTALAVAVFGSTSVAGIVAAALLWRRGRPPLL